MNHDFILKNTKLPCFLFNWRLVAVLTCTVMLFGCEKNSVPPQLSKEQKTQETEKFPSDVRTPPPEAITGPKGVRWQTLEIGSDMRPNDNSTIASNLSIWTNEGKPLFNTQHDKGSTAFTMSSINPFVKKQLKTIGVGGKARVWFPAGTAGNWVSPAWRNSPLFVELEILSVKQTETKSTTFSTGPAPYRFVLPDAAGPPSNASATPEGIHFVYMAHSKGEVPSDAGRVKLEITAWQTKGIILGEPLFLEHKTVTTVSQTPNTVAGILKKMRVGETIRLWLPQEVATKLLPVPKNPSTIVDVTLLSIE